MFTGTANGGERHRLQLTTTYGFRGGYNHNWDPYWNTSVSGAWAAIRYNAVATAGICTNVVAVAVVGTPFTCNPDFQIWQVGTVTRWTPVKNLTFSGEVMYTALDQQYAGVINLPAVAALSKPGAPYELKDQSTWTFLARAQRNF